MISLAPRPVEGVRQPPQVPGEPGVWVFLVCEMSVFTVLFAVILYNRSKSPQIFASGQQMLTKPLGLINTCMLIAGSVMVVLAIGAARRAEYHSASRMLLLAMGCGGTFAAIKAIEYGMVIDRGIWIHTNVYWMVFFVITGAHLLHVFVGVTVLGLTRQRVAAGLVGPRDSELFVSATCYWHLVDLLWLVLFPLFYLVN